MSTNQFVGMFTQCSARFEHFGLKPMAKNVSHVGIGIRDYFEASIFSMHLFVLAFLVVEENNAFLGAKKPKKC